MLRIQFLTSALLASVVIAADFAALGQRSIVTARAVLPPRALYGRQNQFTCAQATDTVCADGSGCCPGGAACFVSAGVGLCSVTCEAAQPTCVFNSVTACCPVGDACGGSLCIPGGLNTGAAPSLTSMEAPPTTPTTLATPTTNIAAVVTISPSSATPTSSTPAVVTISPSSKLSVPSSVAAIAVPSSQSYAYTVVSMSVAAGKNGSVAIVSSTTSITTTLPGLASTTTFGLGSQPTTARPLQVTVNAAPTAGPFSALTRVIGLVALGLVL